MLSLKKELPAIFFEPIIASGMVSGLLPRIRLNCLFWKVYEASLNMTGKRAVADKGENQLPP